MKKIFFAGLVLVVLAACNNNNNNTNRTAVSNTGAMSNAVSTDTTIAPILTFESMSHDFGQVTAGEKVSYNFKFKNTGKSPLIISNALASCGCTVPDYPRYPIAPGKEGSISVVFDSAGKSGVQDKVITLTSNVAATTTQLHLTGEVK